MGPGQRGSPRSLEKVPCRKWAVWPLGSPGPVFVHRAAGWGGSRHMGQAGEGGPQVAPAWSGPVHSCLTYLGKKLRGREAAALATCTAASHQLRCLFWAEWTAFPPPPSWARSRGCEDEVEVKRHLCFVNFACWKTPVLIFMRNDLVSKLPAACLPNVFNVIWGCVYVYLPGRGC